jgi:hypothetical protein
MHFNKSFWIFCFLLIGTTYSSEVYTEARVAQVEFSDDQIIVFLSETSESNPPYSNGASNEPNTNKPYLYLAKSSAEIESRKAHLSGILTALTIGAKVRFRWENNTNSSSYARISTFLLRQ